MVRRRSATRAGTAWVAAGAVVVGAAGLGGGVAEASSPKGGSSSDGRSFVRTATYPVVENIPAGADPLAETVAEISAVSQDGRTLVYTDAAGRRIGFLDIADPSAPVGLGTLDLAELGDAEDEPTSVAVVGGYVLVVVNTSPSFTDPSGRLDVVRLSDRTRVRSLPLAGQPDSIAVSPDGRHATVAIENERDEEATPVGGEEGDLPQLPAGLVQILDLPRADPASWGLRTVPLTRPDGSALPALVRAGLTEPTDPEPEYVTVNRRGLAAVSLQENNGIVLVDVRRGRVVSAFSAGSVTLDGFDTEDDGTIAYTGSLDGVVREPDAIAWVDDRYLAGANEGDWLGGSRGWSVFDSRTGEVAWDAGRSFERLMDAHGLHNEGRADNKGSEPEGLAVATIRGKRLAFVASERSNAVAVYDLSRPTSPRYLQLLPATNGPEGVLPIPSRGLLAVSSEVDDAEVRVRATVSLYALRESAPTFPQIVSSNLTDPIGWGALSGLSAVPGSRSRLVAVTDAAYSPTKILTVSTSGRPARIVDELVLTDAAGTPVGVDAEGVAARADGGWWLAVEGSTGPANRLLQVSAEGAVVAEVPLPAEIGSALGSQGLEGVTTVTDAAGEHVWVTLQRELSTDPQGVVRIGRYDVATGAWTWFGYPIESTDAADDWIGLSEIVAVGPRTFALLERDKLNGPQARVKQVGVVTVPADDPAPGTLPVLEKRVALDLLPALRATNGWTQEKVEGLTVGGDGRLYAVTDNDGVDDATGETVFLRLGPAARVLGLGGSRR